jgi:hypothetical protein
MFLYASKCEIYKTTVYEVNSGQLLPTRIMQVAGFTEIVTLMYYSIWRSFPKDSIL